MKKNTFVIIIAFFSTTLNAQDSLNDLIPDKDEIWNWTIKKPAETFLSGKLYSFIPEDTDLFTEYGFEEAVTCAYRNSMANTIRIDIFKMTSVKAAFGIYSFKALKKKKVTAIGDESALYDYYIDVWKGNYYFRVTANNKHFGMIDTLLLFAGFVDNKILATGKRPALASLMKDSLKYNNIKYFKGIVALDQIYQFGHGSIVGFSEGVAGKKDRATLFIIGYKDFRTAREWIAAAKGKFKHYDDLYSNFELQEKGWSISDKTGTPVSFMPYDRFLLIVKGKEWEKAVKDFEKTRNILEN